VLLKVIPEAMSIPHQESGFEEPVIPINTRLFRYSTLCVEQGLQPIEALEIEQERSVSQNKVNRMETSHFLVGEFALVLHHPIDVIPG
jgi:hypothetical protein